MASGGADTGGSRPVAEQVRGSAFLLSPEHVGRMDVHRWHGAARQAEGTEQQPGSREELEGRSGRCHGDVVGRQQQWHSLAQLAAAPPRCRRARDPVLPPGPGSSNMRAGSELKHLVACLSLAFPGSLRGWWHGWGWTLLSPNAWEKEIVLVLCGYCCADISKLLACVWLHAQPAPGTASAESLLLWQFKLNSTFSSGSQNASV